MTWLLAENEPDVVSRFRIEADPVVNANVITYLGDCPETGDARRWLEFSVAEGSLEGSSKWYPDTTAIYYAIARAAIRVQPALVRLRPILAGRILDLRDEKGEFGMSCNPRRPCRRSTMFGGLNSIDTKNQMEMFVSSQREDGSWPELLAFGDQSLKWGTVGQIGHGSEAVTSAFCIEALERLVESCGRDGLAAHGSRW